MRNFLLIEMSEVILISVAKKKKRSTNLYSTRDRVAKSIHCRYCELRVPREGMK
jgi:hypothetical protein